MGSLTSSLRRRPAAPPGQQQPRHRGGRPPWPPRPPPPRPQGAPQAYGRLPGAGLTNSHVYFDCTGTMVGFPPPRPASRSDTAGNRQVDHHVLSVRLKPSPISAPTATPATAKSPVSRSTLIGLCLGFVLSGRNST